MHDGRLQTRIVMHALTGKATAVLLNTAGRSRNGHPQHAMVEASAVVKIEVIEAWAASAGRDVQGNPMRGTRALHRWQADTPIPWSSSSLLICTVGMQSMQLVSMQHVQGCR